MFSEEKIATVLLFRQHIVFLLIIMIFYFVYRGEDSYSFTIWTTHCIFTNDHVPDSLPTDSQHVTTSYFSCYICQLCRRSTNWKWIRIFQDRWR